MQNTHFIYGYTMSIVQQKTTQKEEEWKEMFYLTMHSEHFTYGYMLSKI